MFQINGYSSKNFLRLKAIKTQSCINIYYFATGSLKENAKSTIGRNYKLFLVFSLVELNITHGFIYICLFSSRVPIIEGGATAITSLNTDHNEGVLCLFCFLINPKFCT